MFLCFLLNSDERTQSQGLSDAPASRVAEGHLVFYEVGASNQHHPSIRDASGNDVKRPNFYQTCQISNPRDTYVCSCINNSETSSTIREQRARILAFYIASCWYAQPIPTVVLLQPQFLCRLCCALRSYAQSGKSTICCSMFLLFLDSPRYSLVLFKLCCWPKLFASVCTLPTVVRRCVATSVSHSMTVHAQEH